MGGGKSGGVAGGSAGVRFTDSAGAAGPSAMPGGDVAARAAESSSGGVRMPPLEEAANEVGTYTDGLPSELSYTADLSSEPSDTDGLSSEPSYTNGKLSERNDRPSELDTLPVGKRIKVSVIMSVGSTLTT